MLRTYYTAANGAHTEVVELTAASAYNVVTWLPGMLDKSRQSDRRRQHYKVHTIRLCHGSGGGTAVATPDESGLPVAAVLSPRLSRPSLAHRPLRATAPCSITYARRLDDLHRDISLALHSPIFALLSLPDCFARTFSDSLKLRPPLPIIRGMSRRAAPATSVWNALIRTHHITSRKKVAKLRQAANDCQVYALICYGGCPGIMYTEGSYEGVKRWVESVHVSVVVIYQFT